MLTTIVDLQYGSTGKGLIAGYLSRKNDYDLVVSANMPNAGHTFVDTDGKKWVNKVLPSGVYSPSLKHICIGPGAVFDPQRLVLEIDELRQRCVTAEIVIHPDAALLLFGHVQSEQALNHIASTMQGSMEATIHKMRRHDTGSNVAYHNHGILTGYQTVDNVALWDYVVTHREWNDVVGAAKNILAEGSQGYSLGINAGFYPYCTSRDCTVWRLLSDCAIPVTDRMKVVGTARTYPIRVGNTPGGNSGGHYADQIETSWKELQVDPEYTTVTQRERRVFTFSEDQIREAMIANRVDEVFLNFCNYNIEYANIVRHKINSIGEELRGGRSEYFVAGDYPPVVRYMGFGPKAEHIIESSHGY